MISSLDIPSNSVKSTFNRIHHLITFCWCITVNTTVLNYTLVHFFVTCSFSDLVIIQPVISIECLQMKRSIIQTHTTNSDTNISNKVSINIESFKVSRIDLIEAITNLVKYKKQRFIYSTHHSITKLYPGINRFKNNIDRPRLTFLFDTFKLK